jgi:hypothetical protein
MAAKFITSDTFKTEIARALYFNTPSTQIMGII